MSHALDQLQPLFRAIMEKLSDDSGYFLKPELFVLAPFEPEDGMMLDGLPPFCVTTKANPAASTEAVNLSTEVEALFLKQIARIATRDGLEIESPEDVWMIAAKNTDTLKTAMETLAKELGVQVSKGTGQGR